jgi:hypothetical protein
MGSELYTCIAFKHGQEKTPCKYRNVNNLDRFYTFAQGEGFVYFNVYRKKDCSFVRKVWIEENFARNLHST